MAENENMELQKTQTEETPEVEPAVEPEVSIEDLKKEIERKESEIKRLQGISKDLQKRGIPKEELDALTQRIDGIEELHATMMDYLVEHLGEPVEEEPTPTKKTYRQQLDERRAIQRVGKRETDPDVSRFINYVDGQGLERNDPLVLEAVGEDRTPQEALKYLRDKIKATNQASVDKLIAEKAKALNEQWLREHGIAASEASGPSAPGSKRFTRESIAGMSLEEYIANKEAITKALEQGRIK